jgi:hypothetical protein
VWLVTRGAQAAGGNRDIDCRAAALCGHGPARSALRGYRRVGGGHDRPAAACGRANATRARSPTSSRIRATSSRWRCVKDSAWVPRGLEAPRRIAPRKGAPALRARTLARYLDHRRNRRASALAILARYPRRGGVRPIGPTRPARGRASFPRNSRASACSVRTFAAAFPHATRTDDCRRQRGSRTACRRSPRSSMPRA